MLGADVDDVLVLLEGGQDQYLHAGEVGVGLLTHHHRDHSEAAREFASALEGALEPEGCSLYELLDLLVTNLWQGGRHPAERLFAGRPVFLPIFLICIHNGEKLALFLKKFW